MKTHTSLSADQKINRLRILFLQQLPQRLQQIRVLFEQLKADYSDQQAMVDLHRSLHSMKGTGRSFGFIQLGSAADKAETLVEPYLALLGQQLPLSWTQQMEEYLTELEHVATIVEASYGPPPTELEAPSLDMFKPYWQEEEYGGRLVYICDDDTLLVEQLATQLACFGYQSIVFTELDKLRSSLHEKQPNALIMDIHFPEGRYAGTDLVYSLRAEAHSQFPVIFLSSRSDFDARLSAVQADGSAYFTKPANIQELITTLDTLTRQQKPEPYRILVIDDEQVVSDYHSVLLQEAGMTTRSVNEPDNILGVLQEFRPDLLLMDMYMPTCSGNDLAKLIRQVHDYMPIPIVYLSSETDKQKQFSAMRIGAEGFLTKPVIPSELVAAVAIRAERMRTLRSLMVRDSLTGLFNHTTTTQLLDTAVANTKRHGNSLCFVMIDLDHFKKVNDTYGHPVGDQVLLALARIMKQRLRTSDVIGRYGGEEFALILYEVTAEKAAELANELRETFSRLCFNSNENTFYCTFSAGIAEFPVFSSLEQIREAADRALYQAKHNGRNQVVIA